MVNTVQNMVGGLQWGTKFLIAMTINDLKQTLNSLNNEGMPNCTDNKKEEIQNLQHQIDQLWSIFDGEINDLGKFAGKFGELSVRSKVILEECQKMYGEKEKEINVNAEIEFCVEEELENIKELAEEINFSFHYQLTLQLAQEKLGEEAEKIRGGIYSILQECSGVEEKDSV